MPTRKEVAKIKADFVLTREQLIRDKMSAKQLELFDIIVKQYLDKIAGKDLTSAQQLSAINAIEKTVRNFSVETNVFLLKEYTQAALSLTDLNMSYFATMFEDPKKLDEIKQKTNKILSKRLGLDEEGQIKPKGFLDKIISDNSIQKQVAKEARKAVSNNYDLKKLQESFKKIIVGGQPGDSGIFERHYNTFAKDILNAIDNSNSKIFADDLGLKYAFYSGGLKTTSRPLCIHYNGKILSTTQIEDLKKDPRITEMYKENIDEYAPFELPGGYGCRHRLDYISDTLAKGSIRKNNKKAAERNEKFF